VSVSRDGTVVAFDARSKGLVEEYIDSRHNHQPQLTQACPQFVAKRADLQSGSIDRRRSTCSVAFGFNLRQNIIVVVSVHIFFAFFLLLLLLCLYFSFSFPLPTYDTRYTK
jgi:hypothetical protein